MKYISVLVGEIILFGLAFASVQNDLISVIQLIPQNNAKLLSLISLFEEGQLDFWRAPSKIGETVDIMVDSKQRKFLEAFASQNEIPFKVIVNDLNKLIAEKEGDNKDSWSSRALKRLNGGRRDLGDTADNRKNDFGLLMKEYHSYADIVAWMFRIESRLGPGYAKVFSIGRTVEGRETYGIKIGETVDIMVDSKQRKFLEAFASQNEIPFKVIVNDLNKLIAEKEGDNKDSWSSRALKRLNGGRRDLGDTADNRKNDFGLLMKEYHSYADIVAWMFRIESRLGPGYAKVFSIGRTVEGRETYGIKFTSPNLVTAASSSSTSAFGGSSKRVVWIDGGIHAREWTSIHTSVYTIFNFANGILQNDTKLMRILENVEIVVFPVLNPDGYEYTRSDPRNALVRMWRKSRSHERCATNRIGEKTCCRGTDLNRNFAYKFAETGTSYHPCSEIYHGAGPFSEPESRNVRDAIINSELTGRIDAYITLHAYSQLFIYPFSNRKRHYPEDVAELKKVAQKAVSAISRLFGTHYLIGTGPEIIYAYAGGSSDWAKETAKIKYSYTIELRPSYYSWNGFVLDKTLLIPTARETFDGITVVLETVASEARNKSAGVARPSTIPPPQSPTFILPQMTRPTTLAPTRMPIHHQRQPQQQQQFSSSCRDSVEDCNRWLSHSPLLCSTSRLSMKRQCAKTCNLC